MSRCGSYLCAAGAFVSLSCSPTEPAERRGGPMLLTVTCDATGATPLRCQARSSCMFYGCSDPRDDDRDVTMLAGWSVEHGTIARTTGPGMFEAVAPGETVVHAAYKGANGQRTISVFPGTAPLPTTAFDGYVYEAGKNSTTGPITGAVVQVLNGLIAGRSAVAGVPGPLPPGFVHLGGPARYKIAGVPPGSYLLRVTAEGYVTQERTAVAGQTIDFALVRQQ